MRLKLCEFSILILAITIMDTRQKDNDINFPCEGNIRPNEYTRGDLDGYPMQPIVGMIAGNRMHQRTKMRLNDKYDACNMQTDARDVACSG